MQNKIKTPAFMLKKSKEIGAKINVGLEFLAIFLTLFMLYNSLTTIHNLSALYIKALEKLAVHKNVELKKQGHEKREKMLNRVVGIFFRPSVSEI